MINYRSYQRYNLQTFITTVNSRHIKIMPTVNRKILENKSSMIFDNNQIQFSMQGNLAGVKRAFDYFFEQRFIFHRYERFYERINREERPNITKSLI